MSETEHWPPFGGDGQDVPRRVEPLTDRRLDVVPSDVAAEVRSLRQQLAGAVKDAERLRAALFPFLRLDYDIGDEWAEDCQRARNAHAGGQWAMSDTVHRCGLAGTVGALAEDRVLRLKHCFDAETRLRWAVEADAEMLALAVIAFLTHGEQSPLVDALGVYLTKHPWSDS